MRRPLLIFMAFVLLPGLLLGGFAFQSIRSHDALLALERNRRLEDTVGRVAQSVAARLDEHQRDFSLRVESLLARDSPADLARSFDVRIREHWSPAQLGFAVALSGGLLSPAILSGAEARQFLVRNDDFLCNRSSVEVFAVTPKGKINLSSLDPPAAYSNVLTPPPPATQRFAHLIGEAQEGVLARFVDDQLAVWVWYRTSRDPDIVFGAQLSIARLRENLKLLIQNVALPASDLAIALLDERGQPVATHPSEPSRFDWAKALQSAAVGPTLPNWRVAALPTHPAAASAASRRLAITLGSVIFLLVAALAVGGWIVATDARRQLQLARRKSDFVSNVSHELKTPLTSIQMFAEMLAEDRISDTEKQRRHLGIIRSEASRLNRLISRILDFSRHERGDVALKLEPLDLNALARDVLGTFQPQLASDSMAVETLFPPGPVPVRADRDALTQLLNNLLSNASKYAASGREITLRSRIDGRRACLEVLDRGPGIPAGCHERIFEEFFRADDALSSAVQGAGLGLTLARRIARAHHGDLIAFQREGGGAGFRLELPLDDSEPTS